MPSKVVPSPSIDCREAFTGCRTEPVKFGLIFRLTLLQQPQTLAHYIAGVAEASGVDAIFDECVEAFGQVDSASPHRWHLKYRIKHGSQGLTDCQGLVASLGPNSALGSAFFLALGVGRRRWGGGAVEDGLWCGR